VNVVVVFCHPSEDSFVAHLRDRLVAPLRAGGHDVTVLDTGRGTASAAADRLVLGRAEVLAFVYPTWWSGVPGALADWVGAVWPEPTAGGPSRPAFPGIRRLAVVTTHGSSRLVNAAEGRAGRLLLTRALPAACHPRCRVSWHAVYGLDRARPARRRRFADRVERLAVATSSGARSW